MTARWRCDGCGHVGPRGRDAHGDAACESCGRPGYMLSFDIPVDLRVGPFKTCTCGVALTRDEWFALPLAGEMTDEVERLELRTHGCGSTISVTLEVFRQEGT